MKFRKTLLATLISIGCAASFGQNIIATGTTYGPINALGFTASITIPQSYVGSNSKIWLAILHGDQVYFLTDSAGFVQYIGGLAALASPQPTEAPSLRTIISTNEVVSISGNASGAIGAQIYVGYGSTFTDLINNAKYKNIATISNSPAANISTVSTLNWNPKHSIAGIWNPVDQSNLSATNNGGVIANAEILPLGRDQYGVVLSGWGWTPSAIKPEQVSIALYEPDGTGGLTDKTAALLGNSITNGSQRTLIADFNGDGKADIFLPPYNETPFMGLSSTAFLSNSDGTFSKVALQDNVNFHDGSIGYINGKPVIASATWTKNASDLSPIYSFSNGSFIKSVPPNKLALSGAFTAAIGNFGRDGALELVHGAVGNGYDATTGYDSSITFNVYPFNGTDITSTTPIQSIPLYLSTLPQYKTFLSQWGPGISYAYQSNVDDVNNDGRPDIVLSTSMWGKYPVYPAAMDIMVNQPDGTFKDMTGSLFPNENIELQNVDTIDIDHSGIKTYFSNAMTLVNQNKPAGSNYVLLNDGTVHFYVALHDQFAQQAIDVWSYLAAKYDVPYVTWVNKAYIPAFVANPQPDGSINFVAQASTSTRISDTITQTKYYLVNVPLSYKPAVDFTQNVTVRDRNNSTLMRTWAGNDTFYDVGSNTAPAHIDGGLGSNTCIYSGTYSQYSITHNADGSYTVSTKGGSNIPAITDTLVRIQTLQFSDKVVALN